MFPNRRPIPLVLFFCLYLAGSSLGFCAESQEPTISNEYVLRAWDVNDGLPSNHIVGMAQTPDGYLWLATWWAGLVRFDGVQFTPIQSESTQGKQPKRVQTVFCSRDGSLWVGKEQGEVVRRNGGRFETVLPAVPRSTNMLFVTSFAEDPSGAVWIG